MKKKVVSYLILACTIFGMAMVGSCRDYDDVDSLYQEVEKLKSNDGNLADTIKSIQNKLATIKSCACDVSSLRDSLDSLYKYLGSIAGDSVGAVIGYTGSTGLSGVLTTINVKLTDAAAVADTALDTAKWVAQELRNLRLAWSDSLKQAFDNAITANTLANQNAKDIDTLKSKVDRAIDRIDSLAALDHHSHTQAFFDSVKTAYETAQTNKERIDSLAKVTDTLAIIAKQYLDSALAYADTVANHVKVELNTRIDSVEAQYKRADSLIREDLSKVWDSIRYNSRRIDTVSWKIDTIMLRLDSIEARLDTIEARLDSVEQKVNDLMDAEKKRITSLYVQGTDNPTFGSFALPIGVRSNILMSYYGDFDAVEFPTKKTAKMVDESTVITSREATLLGLDGIKDNFGGDVIFGDSLGNAGKIYFTVNPNEVVIDSTYHFSFVNSLGDSVKVKLDSIKPSTDKLTFGLNYRTRSGGSTGFYEAMVTIESVSDELKPRIDKDALISVAEDLKNFRDGVSLSSLSSNLIKQLDGVLDANALKVVWEDSLGEHSVTSGYDVAVATVTPLGYSTFKRVLPSTNRRLPLNPLDELLSSISTPTMTLTFDTVKLSGMSIAIPNVTYDMADRKDSLKIVISTTVPINVSGDNGYGSTINLVGTGTVKDSTWVHFDSVYSTMHKEIEALIDSMNVALDNVEAKVDSAVKNIQGQIQREVNKMLTSVQGQLQTNVNKMFDDVKTQIGGNKFVSKINTLTNRINRVLDNVEALFDVSMLYADDNGDLHPMSGSLGLASVFTGSGTYRLYPTSFTAEIVTPAYKKYVAVTNVINNSTGMDAKADDDPDCVAKLNAANSGDVNTILDGTTKYVDANLQAGYTYEILYSALDYTGGISNRRFYVRVK